MEGLIPVLSKALAFVAIIAMGYLLKRSGFFQVKDFYFISKIVIRITLPAAIVFNFSQIEIEPALLLVCVVGFLINVVLVLAGYCINIRKSKADQAFSMVNTSGYNIGNFTIPFVQSFLGPVGFAATSLFDTGNAIMCTGITYSAALAVLGKEGKPKLKAILKNLFSSIPFDTYIIMTILTMLQIRLPIVCLEFARTVGNSNAFLALLMLGIGFEIRLSHQKIYELVKILLVRYGIALLFALGIYFLSPFSLAIRQALAIVAFGPISSISPAYTGELGGDVELASAVNSISILISICAITLAIIVIL